MNYIKISKPSFEDIFKLIIIEPGSPIVLNNGSINIRYQNDNIISLKSSLGSLKCCINGELFKEFTNIQKAYLSFRKTSTNELKIKAGSFRGLVYLLVEDYDWINLDLWSNDIKWCSCPDPIIEPLFYLADVASKSKCSDQPAHAAVHIVDGYLVAAEDIFFNFARYKLSSSLPFDISLHPSNIRHILSRMKQGKLLRVAEVWTLDEEPKRGLAFDFGDIRIWIPSAEVNEKSTCEEKERFSGLISYGWRYVINVVHKLLNTPCQFIAVVPPRAHVSIPVKKDDLITIKFTSGKLLFSYCDMNFKWRSELILEDLGIESPVKVKVEPQFFLPAFKGKRLIGLLEYDDIKLLYFRNMRLEHLIKTE